VNDLTDLHSFMYWISIGLGYYSTAFIHSYESGNVAEDCKHFECTYNALLFSAEY